MRYREGGSLDTSAVQDRRGRGGRLRLPRRERLDGILDSRRIIGAHRRQRSAGRRAGAVERRPDRLRECQGEHERRDREKGGPLCSMCVLVPCHLRKAH